MNRVKVAREMVEAAKMLMGAADGDVFTVKKPIRFKPEGSTMYSLANARMIAEAGYKFVKATFAFNNVKGTYSLTAFFERDGEVASHIFKGFNYNYGGEGPHGMVEFGQIFGIHLDQNKILVHDASGLPEEGVVDLERAFG